MSKTFQRREVYRYERLLMVAECPRQTYLKYFFCVFSISPPDKECANEMKKI